ncbi:MAG: type II secretion system protein [Candidatus Paceibacterota bacterium]|jgi:prepilin-type N-terminal cleavage/methylation domain-containing protein|nr:type II secretion system GspH family protein [Candidatus Paceibacterota bacterium]
MNISLKTLRPSADLKLKGRRGFTIIELVVAVGIFSMVFVSVSGAFISVIDSYQKVTNTRTNVDNLTTAIESLTRGAKTGTNFHCSSSSGNFDTPMDCAGGGNYFSFTNKNIPRPPGRENDPIVYRFVPCVTPPAAYCDRIQRSDDGGSTYYPVTVAPPAITIQSVKFYVIGSDPFPNEVQPQAIIVLRGTVGVKPKIVVPFSIQTTLSQRALDVSAM